RVFDEQFFDFLWLFFTDSRTVFTIRLAPDTTYTDFLRFLAVSSGFGDVLSHKITPVLRRQTHTVCSSRTNKT
ncbi:hypothetical protein, partial [Acinetobacter baumannii]|uniref:hypothetical protein n=1 Tax=Acinetobacter baumannii TaxID=470 RepID=UPI001C079202